ncbi:threonine/serine ThrE exporter family protein [Streptomyces beijiangensis]|uniref:Threonine/serine exporter family protein n=1 Tax=Streptomyces beijiangensis TaxID=163361 RepID=A0A939JFI5_9ACTN|nr:threonine/serine exporter family protein [Streptomyces beijiangensis]MBO0514171.1 threonine/serine exporter family protein [Streptomyces beijiangensis]
MQKPPHPPYSPTRPTSDQTLPWLAQALPRIRGLEPTITYGYAGELLHDDGRADMDAHGARVADLVIRLGEALLSYGAPAEESVAGMLITAESFGLSHVEPSVTLSSVYVSGCAPGVLSPVHASRVIRKHATDFRTLARIQALVSAISTRQLSLTEARKRAASILDGRAPAGRWARLRFPVLTGLVAAGAGLVFGGGILESLSALLAAFTGALLCAHLGRHGVPAFYRYALAAMPAALTALAVHTLVPETSSQAIVVAGILGLLPTVTFVSAVQDSLTGHYLTALGRLFDALLIFTAVITGVVVILGLGTVMGLDLPMSASIARGGISGPAVVGVIVFAVAVAARSRARRQDWLPAAGIALGGYCVLVGLGALGFSSLAATATAAITVGAAGQALARRRHESGIALVVPGMAPLLPGGTLYLALTDLASGRTPQGVGGLVHVAAITLILAVGGNLTAECAHFLRQARSSAARQEREGVRTPCQASPRDL